MSILKANRLKGNITHCPQRFLQAERALQPFIQTKSHSEQLNVKF